MFYLDYKIKVWGASLLCHFEGLRKWFAVNCISVVIWE